MQRYKVVFLDSARAVTGAYEFEAGIEPDPNKIVAHLWKTFRHECDGIELRHEDRVLAERFEPARHSTLSGRFAGGRWRSINVIVAGAALTLITVGFFFASQSDRSEWFSPAGRPVSFEFEKDTPVRTTSVQPTMGTDRQSISQARIDASEEAMLEGFAKHYQLMLDARLSEKSTFKHLAASAKRSSNLEHQKRSRAEKRKSARTYR
jgi:hypothetical protein